MSTWFTSDAGRWFCIGVIASSIFGNLARGWGDPVNLTVGLILLVLLLVLLTYALQGDRRPWLRTVSFTEKSDGKIVVADRQGQSTSEWVSSGR